MLPDGPHPRLAFGYDFYKIFRFLQVFRFLKDFFLDFTRFLDFHGIVYFLFSGSWDFIEGFSGFRDFRD